MSSAFTINVPKSASASADKDNDEDPRSVIVPTMHVYNGDTDINGKFWHRFEEELKALSKLQSQRIRDLIYGAPSAVTEINASFSSSHVP